MNSTSPYTRLNPFNYLFRSRCLVCSSPQSVGIICRRCFPNAPLAFSESQCICCSAQKELMVAGQKCSLCQNSPDNIRYQRFLWPYQGLVRDLIIAMKYSPSKKLTYWMAQSLLSALPHQFQQQVDWDMIIPIPSSPQNYARRLFCPTQLLSKPLARILSLPLHNNILFHRNTSQSQSTLNHSERRRKAPQSLRARDINLKDKRILLIDDVVTTGATAQCATTILLSLGARSVDLYSLARSPSWETERYHC